MALCDCKGCAGYGAWKAEEAARAEARRADFEAWLAAGKPDLTTWRAAKGDKAYGDLTIAEAEALNLIAEGTK